MKWNKLTVPTLALTAAIIIAGAIFSWSIFGARYFPPDDVPRNAKFESGKAHGVQWTWNTRVASGYARSVRLQTGIVVVDAYLGTPTDGFVDEQAREEMVLIRNIIGDSVNGMTQDPSSGSDQLSILVPVKFAPQIGGCSLAPPHQMLSSASTLLRSLAVSKDFSAAQSSKLVRNAQAIESKKTVRLNEQSGADCVYSVSLG